MLALLRMTQFRRLVGAWTIGNFADSALFLTLAIWAKELTGSSGAAGLVFLFLGAPMLASPLFGLLADRVRRRPLMIAGNVLAAAAVLGLLAVRTPTDLWLLYSVTAIYGALGALNSSAQSGLLRTMLDDEQLGPANAMFSTIDQGLRIITPLVGAGLYALWGGPALAVGTAALLVVTAVGLCVVRVDEPDPSAAAATQPTGADASGQPQKRPDDTGWAALVAGFVHVWRTVQLRNIVIGLAIALSVIGVFDSLLFAVIEHGLHRPPEFFGVLVSAQGAGSILGGLTAARLMRAVGPTRSVAIGLGLMAAGAAPFLTGLESLVLLGMLLVGVAIPWAFVAMATTRQRLTPNNLQGRAASATGMSLQIPQLASTGVGAALVTVVDYRVLTVIAAAVIAGSALWLYSRHRRDVAPDSAQAATESAAGHLVDPPAEHEPAA